MSTAVTFVLDFTKVFHFIIYFLFILTFVSEYLEVVSHDIALQGEQCLKNINTAFNQLEKMFQNNIDGNITAMFNLCTEMQIPLASEMDKLNLFEYIIDFGFAHSAQTHRPNRTMKDLCDVMNNNSIELEVDRLGEMMLSIYEDTCFEAHWDKYVESLKNETADDAEMSEYFSKKKKKIKAVMRLPKSDRIQYAVSFI